MPSTRRLSTPLGGGPYVTVPTVAALVFIVTLWLAGDAVYGVPPTVTSWAAIVYVPEARPVRVPVVVTLWL